MFCDGTDDSGDRLLTVNCGEHRVARPEVLVGRGDEVDLERTLDRRVGGAVVGDLDHRRDHVARLHDRRRVQRDGVEVGQVRRGLHRRPDALDVIAIVRLDHRAVLVDAEVDVERARRPAGSLEAGSGQMQHAVCWTTLFCATPEIGIVPIGTDRGLKCFVGDM